MTFNRKKKIIAAVLTVVMTLTGTGISFVTNSIADAKESSAAEADADTSRADYADDQVLVSFDAGTSGKSIKKILKENDASLEDQLRIGDEKIVLAGIDEDSSVGKALSDLDEESKVNYVQPNYVYKAAAADPFLSKSSTKYQYIFDMLHIKDVWSELGAENTSKIKLAVLDTGVDIFHEDLKDSVSTYKKIEDGKVTDAKEDTGDHGTHVTGIIAASYNNGKGGAGIAAGENNDLTETAVYSVSQDGENMYSYDIITGISAAADDGARVINMSFGGYNKDRLLLAAIRKAYYEEGIAFVAAAGNEATNEFMEPSDISEVISVCACGENGAMMPGTNYGRTKDIAAPGTSIVSTAPGDLYARKTGTSMSAPVVTGICGLVLCASPDLEPAQLRNIICSTAVTDPEGLSENYYQKNELGYGLVDPKAAVSAAKQEKTAAVDSIEIKKEKNDDTITVCTDNIDKSIFGDGDNEYIIRGTGLEALIKPANSSAKITWSSDDPHIAEVDKHGYVTGLKAGKSTTIRARAGGKTASVKVSVKSSIDPDSVSLKIRDSEKTMYTGEISGRLAECVSLLPEDSNPEMYWFSSDPDVIAVNEEGWLTAKEAGRATITVRTYNGREASCEMTVRETPAKIEIKGGTDWLMAGQSATFSAAIKDDKGNLLKDEKGTFSSGNKAIAAVTKDGKVTAKKDGNFYLIAEVSVPVMSEDDAGKLVVYKKITVTKKDYKGKDYGLKKKKAGKRYAVLKWNKIPKASGYELERAGKKNGKYKLIKKLPASSVTYKNKGLKKGKKYYYRIRATYVKDGKAGKYSYSRKVKVKTKK